MTVATAPTAPAERTFTDRLLAAVPLLSIFLWLCIVYAIEAWAHGTPWLFGDELELTQLSRSIADTGHAARRGEAHSFNTLWTYALAPAWLIDDVHTAYATVKYIAVFVMTATAFPAYKLARLVVGRRPALFVAAAAAAIPSLAYSSMIVEEPLAYPYSTLCLWLILRTLIQPSRWWIVGAAAASLVAPFVRGELAVISVIFVLASLFLIWKSAWVTQVRGSWSRADWIGFGVLIVGAAVVVSALLGHRSFEWLVATRLYKDRMFDLGFNAAGALAIGLGVLPVIAGLAVLWRLPGEVPTRELRAFRCVLLASVIAFGMYTAVKSTYVSTTFGTYTYERNLIYLSPLLFAGTAIWLERRSINPYALAASSVFVLILLLTTPYEMGQDISYNAPGLAILQQANRHLAVDPGLARAGLIVLLLLSVALLATPRLLKTGTVWVALIVAGGVLAWNLTGELAFASASNRASDRFDDNLRQPFTWVDDVTGGAPAVYLGQRMSPDQNGEWLLEFWNRSIQRVWSLDGTAQGPGPTLTPDARPSDGVLNHSPGFPYVVEETGIDVAGKEVARHDHIAGGHPVPWRLIKVDPPLRLRASVTGIYPDGWSGPTTAYTRYSTEGNKTGRVRVRVSREAWGGIDKPGNVTIKIGPIVIGPDKEPHVGNPALIKKLVIHSKQVKTVTLDAPGPRFRVEVTVDPTFRPIELSPQTTSDGRDLGASVTYQFLPPRNAAHR
jgi:hypothetical protein